METALYNQEGRTAGTTELPERIFGAPWNADLVHQVVESMQANLRRPYAHTKGRGEVRGGGKKPWRQKGTGRARHGSTRSPIWVGGGVSHGPRKTKVFSRTVPHSMKVSALRAVLSRKYRDREVLFMNALSVPSAKTKDAKRVLDALGGISGYEALKAKKKNAAYIALSRKDVAVERSFNNIGSVSMGEVRNMNPLDLLSHRVVILENPERTLEILKKRT